MIDFVRGTVARVGADQIVVDVGSVGLVVLCPPATAASARHGEHVELLTSLVVREDGWTIYGFADEDERRVFEQVQTVSGIGPRIALALLGTLSPDELRRAVASGDEAALMKVPGIGRKGAQRVILELADRLGPAASVGSASSGSGSGGAAGGWRASVEAGLMSLGWSAREAEQAVGAIPSDVVAAATTDGATPDVAALLKWALRSLDRS